MRANGLDLVTQRWVRITGRRVDLSRDRWLQGPVGGTDSIADSWLTGEAERIGATVADGADAAGLLAPMSMLDCDEFSAEALAPHVRGFYEQTSKWQLDATVTWSAWAWPFGWVLSRVFSRRLEQLAIPLRERDLAGGMTSAVMPLHRAGEQVAALWLRRLRSTNAVVFSGLYSSVVVPVSGRPAIKVDFPLPNGRVVVLLEPRVGDGGSLQLRSTRGGWGSPGAYFVVETARGCWARRVAIHETFDIYVDDDGQLRTDHRLALGALPVLRLHYRLTSG